MPISSDQAGTVTRRARREFTRRARRDTEGMRMPQAEKCHKCHERGGLVPFCPRVGSQVSLSRHPPLTESHGATARGGTPDLRPAARVQNGTRYHLPVTRYPTLELWHSWHFPSSAEQVAETAKNPLGKTIVFRPVFGFQRRRQAPVGGAGLLRAHRLRKHNVVGGSGVFACGGGDLV
jgi:hypothetical protein